jgi:hypothetical protein
MQPHRYPTQEQQFQTKLWHYGTSIFKEAMKATNLSITKTSKTLDNTLNIIRALMPGATNPITPSNTKTYKKKRVITIINDGIETLISDWQ